MFLSLLFAFSLFGFTFFSGTACGTSQYYDQQTATCKSCDPTCKTCFGPSKNHCSSCLDDMTLSNSWCICAAGEYFHVQPLKCKACNNQCAISCTGNTPSHCSGCVLSQFDYLDQCYSRCSATQYF